jgi:hypothetical protein
MKRHPHHNNEQNKGPEPHSPASTANNDKGAKSKSKKTGNKHCNFCGKDGHEESKCFKKMTTLEAAMKKHNINIDSYSSTSSSSHGHALSSSSFSFNATSTSSFDEWLIDSRASYHMAKDKAIFSSLNECNTKKIFVGDDRSLSVVGSGTIQVVIKDLKDPKHVLATMELLMILPGCTSLTTLGHHLFHQFLFLIVMT